MGSPLRRICPSRVSIDRIPNRRTRPSIGTPSRTSVASTLHDTPTRAPQRSGWTRIPPKWTGATRSVRLERVAPVHLGGIRVQPDLWGARVGVSWSVEATLVRDGVPIDGLVRRFGMRSIETRDGQILLNGEPIYLLGALDQDLWPE